MSARLASSTSPARAAYRTRAVRSGTRGAVLPNTHARFTVKFTVALTRRAPMMLPTNDPVTAINTDSMTTSTANPASDDPANDSS